MTLAELHESIEKYIIKEFELQLKYNSGINPAHMATEILARLFTLSFCESRPNSFAFHNVNAFNFQNHSEFDADIFNNLAYNRWYVKKYLVAHENKIRQTPNISNVPNIMKMENNKKGRNLDMPNLLLISDYRRTSYQVLLRLIFTNRICDSKKASDTCLADAYNKYDQDYSNAQMISEPKEYIFRWVNFHRIETEYHLSIIPQIADAILEEKSLGTKTWSYDDLVGIFGNYSYGMTNYYAYQILTNYNYINLLFSRDSTWSTSDVIQINHCVRSIQTATVKHFNQISKETFQSFFEEDSKAITDIYDFCRNQYPLIDEHPKSNLYLNKKQLNKPKIKLIRKIIASLLDVEGISKQFQNAP